MSKTTRPYKKWTTLALLREAQKYSTTKEFSEGSKSAYNTAYRRGLFELVCKGMKTAKEIRIEEFLAEVAKKNGN